MEKRRPANCEKYSTCDSLLWKIHHEPEFIAAPKALLAGAGACIKQARYLAHGGARRQKAFSDLILLTISRRAVGWLNLLTTLAFAHPPSLPP